MNLKGLPVLVTGGTGFLGGRLVEKLILDCQADVRVLVHQFSHASRIARFPLKMYPGSIQDASAIDDSIQDCSIVFHCAYDFSCVLEGERNVNRIGAQNIARAAVKHNARLIHVSTVDVYGWPPVDVLEETTPRVRPANHYGRTKSDLEAILLHFHRTEGLAVTILQPTVVYGPFGGWTLTPIQQIRQKKLILVDNGEGICNPVYVDDVVQAILRAAQERNAGGETLLISGTHPISWREYFAFYEDMLGMSGTITVRSKAVEEEWRKKAKENHALRLFLRLIRDPRTRAKLQSIPTIKRLMGILNPTGKLPAKTTDPSESSPTISTFLIEELPLYRTRAKISIEKARRILGFNPKFDLKQGMELTAQFLRWANLI